MVCCSISSRRLSPAAILSSSSANCFSPSAITCSKRSRSVVNIIAFGNKPLYMYNSLIPFEYSATILIGCEFCTQTVLLALQCLEKLSVLLQPIHGNKRADTSIFCHMAMQPLSRVFLLINLLSNFFDNPTKHALIRRRNH